jgi:WD40 repeat protein
MAEQQHPVRRKVALKVIKPGMDSKQVIARFEAERQALALMDHPHIARVLEVGATDTGRPYFAMELVRGIPITQFCEDNRLTPRERLELFGAVCQAVQHAHQKGIIHRDLKPSNVLVTLSDGTPLVKVIDFGIAKALGQERLTDKTVFTGFAHMIGTPLYMSPEQAEMSGQDVDTRTDIYALGVLLYELLTGTTPFDKERLKEASYDKIRRIIREEEPAKPSSRISTLGQLATTVSANRKSEPRHLSHLFRRELDWIVMKALEKDRNRRYETASSFAADVQRYLHDEPVQACPPSAVYRFHKFARRNKAALITASAITIAVLLAVTGLAVSTTLIWQANQELRVERSRAEEKTEKARRLLYSSDLIVARQAWEEGHLARARELLERQRPHEDEEDLRGFEWRYLWRLCRDSSLHTFAGHTGGVMAVRFSPDGKVLVSASKDGTVQLWDVAARRAIVQLLQQGGDIFTMALTPDGKLLAIGTSDNRVELWDVVARRQVAAWQQAGAGVKFSPDGKILAAGWGGGGDVRLWDVTTRQELSPLKGLGEVIAFSPDGSMLATYAWPATVQLWDMATRELIAALQGHTADVVSLAFSPDGKLLASGGRDAMVKLWDVATRQVVKTLYAQTTLLNSLAFSPDGKTLVTGTSDSTVKFWDTATWQEVRTLRGHTAEVSSVAFSPDGKLLATGSGDIVKLWDTAPETEPTVLPANNAWIWSLAFSPDGKTLASTGGVEATVKLWNVASGRQVAALTEQGGSVSCVRFSPDGHTLASTSKTDKTVRVWDVAARRMLARLVHTQEHLWAARFSPDGKTLASSDGEAVRLWDVATGQERGRLPGSVTRQSFPSWAFAFAPDGKTLATGDDDGTIRLWGPTTQQTIMTFDKPAAAAGDGSRAANGPTGIRDLAFSPDGLTLASAGWDNTVRLWEPTTGREIVPFRGHTGIIFRLAFAPDGKTLATSSFDGTVKLWNLKVRAEVATLRGHRGPIPAVAFAPDGNLMATAGADGKIRLWRASPFEETDPFVQKVATAGRNVPTEPQSR